MSRKSSISIDQLNDADTWVANNVTFELESSIFFAEIYDKYKIDILETKVIPLSKNTFSQRLRMFLSTPISENKVELTTRGGVFIKGVELKSQIKDTFYKQKHELTR